MKEDSSYRPRHPEMQEKYEEVSCPERNRDRQEYRWYSVCTECSLLTKTQKEWPFIKTVGMARQVRILVKRDAEGNDIIPDIKLFWRRDPGEILRFFIGQTLQKKRIKCKGDPHRQESSLIDNMPVINMNVEGDS